MKPACVAAHKLTRKLVFLITPISPKESFGQIFSDESKSAGNLNRLVSSL
jgi:hypothetical protein